MKIRVGFVSNSSSSSFVMGFKKIPETEAELMEMMFPEGTKEIRLYDDWDPVSTKEIVAQVLKDINNQVPNDLRNIVEEAGVPHNVLSDYDSPEFIKGKKKSEDGYEYNDYDWDKIHEVHEKQSRQFIDDFMKKHPDLVWFVFEYSDNDSTMSTVMEHGDIFRNIAGYTVSKH